MSNRCISIDCMGGDGAPDITVHGLALVMAEVPDFDAILFGDSVRINELLTQYRVPTDRVRVFETAGFEVDAEMKPSFAIRNAMRSSMGMAIAAVKDGEAEACVSAGNTGAYMGLARVILKMIPGVSRPAIATVMPGKVNPFVMLDLGANAECAANNLVEFALMGEAFAKAALNLDTPSTALLNIGSEENKGSEHVRGAFNTIRGRGFLSDFRGFIEGDQIFDGAINVVVSDGFCGNVVLKVIEGCARFIVGEVKESLGASLISKLGALLSSRSIKKRLAVRLDPRKHNGAILLGVNGVVVKSHGGTDAVGFANALKFTLNVVQNKLVENTIRIVEDSDIENIASELRNSVL